MLLLCIFLFFGKVIALEEEEVPSEARGVEAQRDACSTKGLAGVCKLLKGCPYADRLVRIEEKRPTHCGWLNNNIREEIVCCPNEDKSHEIGVYGRIFRFANHGVITYGDKYCRYEGEQPFICCPEVKDPLPQEPAGCPPVPKIQNPKNRNDLIWRKCQEYQRYLYPCVSSSSDVRRYERILQCAQDDSDIRISEGEPANPAEFPHMALLGCRTSDATRWVAGGSLISDQFILTAAHAISHPEYGLVRYALLGTVTKNSRDGEIFNTVQHIPHAEYQKNKYNDIALLKLDRKVTMSMTIRPTCLPMKNVKLSEARYVSGWGRTSVNDKQSEVLLKTPVKIYDPSRCQKRLDFQKLDKGWITETMICAGDDTSKKDTCEGDSGGPLQAYMDDLNCTYVVEGVVANGPTCGQGDPGVYTRVEPYLDWITKIVWPGEH